jgi:hypothetical protein
MKRFVLVLSLLLLPTLHAQKAEFTASTVADACIDKGVMATLSYKLPINDANTRAAMVDSKMVPTTAIWYWGDDESGAKTRNHTDAKYGDTVTHLYTKPGVYGIFVVVNDAKNRNIREASVKITVQSPIVIE